MRFTNPLTVTGASALPVLLVGLPLMAVVALGLRGLTGDRALRAARIEAERVETARARVDEAAATAGRWLTEVGASAMARAVAGIDDPDDPITALRALINVGDAEPGLALVVAWRGERRVFPPEESANATPAEARRLTLLSGALIEARRRLDGVAAGNALRWRWVTDVDGPAPLACRRGVVAAGTSQSRGADPLDLCVLLDGPAVRAGMRPAFGRGRDVATDGEGGWRLVPTPPGEVSDAPGALAERDLDGPLAGWRLAAVPTGPAPPTSPVWPLYLAVGAPLLGFWALSAWYVFQRQRDALDEERRRVEAGAQLAHDLRTPLANLRLYVDLIRRRADDPAGVLGYATILDAEVARLTRIADDGVRLVRRGPGEAPGELMAPGRVFDPLALAGEVIRGAEPALSAAGCPVALTGGRGGVGGIDARVFERALINLLDNARKFAPGLGVDVDVHPGRRRDGRGDEVTLTVRDRGPGMAAADPAAKGAGLGLRAVERMATAHGGGLSLEDAAPGLRAVVRLRAMPGGSGGSGGARGEGGSP